MHCESGGIYMKKYETPVMEVIEINNEIITTSCGMGDSSTDILTPEIPVCFVDSH